MTTPPATRRGLTSFRRDLLREGRLVALVAVTRVERPLPPGITGVHTPAGEDVAPAAAAVEPRAAIGACGG